MAIKAEHKWLKEQHRKFNFDLVISDNRYGLYHKNLQSVILTHQLSIQSGKGRIVNKLIQKSHYRLLNKFSECWIVDHPGIQGLSGHLGHPAILPKNSTYIGSLSQLLLLPAINNLADKVGKELKQVLVLISGPEPMRFQLEELLLKQIVNMDDYTFTFIAGNPKGKAPTKLPHHVTFHSYLTANQLKEVMVKADIVVCRSGYSTVMDIAAMQKKALLIPTPGQTEQEYLAKHLQEGGFYHYALQKHLKLEVDLQKAMQYKGINATVYQSHSLMHKAIDKLEDALFGPIAKKKKKNE